MLKPEKEICSGSRRNRSHFSEQPMSTACCNCSIPEPKLRSCSCGNPHYYCERCLPWHFKCSVFAPFSMSATAFFELNVGCNACRGLHPILTQCVSDGKCRHYYCTHCHLVSLLCKSTTLHFSANSAPKYSSIALKQSVRDEGLAAGVPVAAPIGAPVVATAVSPVSSPKASVATESTTTSRPARKQVAPKRYSPYPITDEQKKAKTCQVRITNGDREGLLCGLPVVEAGSGGLCKKHHYYNQQRIAASTKSPSVSSESSDSSTISSSSSSSSSSSASSSATATV